MANQSADFKFFVENHDELFAKYPNKSLVIKDGAVRFACADFSEALSVALEAGLMPGEFIIQDCTEGDSAYTQSFRSRVVFA